MWWIERMIEAPPPWPNKLTREQAKAAKQRERDFLAVLKSRGRTSGWRFSSGELFKQQEDWFVSNMPSLAWQRGTWSRLMVKPMSLDPLFWDIVGLPENKKQPLSFRANGAWVLRPEWRTEAVAPHEESLVELAHRMVEWTDQQLSGSSAWSIDAMLDDLGPDAGLKYQKRSLAVCLHLLKGDLDRAQYLCREAGDQTSLMADGGGFGTHNADGTHLTFIQQAQEWIASERRKSLRPAL